MKSLLIVLSIFLTIQTQAQEHISLSVHQDARLALLGDNKGNKAGTLNLLARFKMQGKQQGFGYMIVFPEFEYANIAGIYKRYSANAGYTLNKLIIPKTEASASIGYGWIDRYGKTMFSWSAAGELAYRFNTFKVSLVAQYTQRKDLLWLYAKEEFRFSGFIGLEFNLN